METRVGIWRRPAFPSYRWTIASTRTGKSSTPTSTAPSCAPVYRTAASEPVRSGGLSDHIKKKQEITNSRWTTLVPGRFGRSVDVAGRSRRPLPPDGAGAQRRRMRSARIPRNVHARRSLHRLDRPQSPLIGRRRGVRPVTVASSTPTRQKWKNENNQNKSFHSSVHVIEREYVYYR